MKSILRKIRDRCLSGLARREDLDILYKQFEGLLQIHRAMEGRPVLAPMRGWAISPDALTWILAAIQDYETPTVIEFGSGVSTVILAATLKHQGGNLITVEHDPAYLKNVQKGIASSGLEDAVNFVISPLIRSEEGILTYDVSKIPEKSVSLALIDGPPCRRQSSLTRLIPLQWAAEHITPGGVIYLDDAAREDEQACIKTFAAELHGWKISRKPTEKGLLEIRKG